MVYVVIIPIFTCMYVVDAWIIDKDTYVYILNIIKLYLERNLFHRCILQLIITPFMFAGIACQHYAYGDLQLLFHVGTTR